MSRILSSVLTFLLFGISQVLSQSCSEYVMNDDYYAVKDDCVAYTQSEAQSYCDSTFGSDLATINSRTMNRGLYDLRLTLDNGNTYNAWIGASDEAEEGTWRWPDGSLATYTAWFNNEPNNYLGVQNCAIMGSGSSRWDDQDCTATFNAFYCDRPATPRPTSEPTNKPSSSPVDSGSWSAGTWWARNP